MNKYELALVVDAKIEEDVRVATVEKAKDYVTKFGGNITNVDEWGKKKLAYEIDDQAEGYYVLYTFNAKPEFPAEFERVLKITDGVMRCLVTVK